MNIQEENRYLVIEALKRENNLLKAKMEKMLEEEAAAKERVAQAARQAEEIKRSSLAEYALAYRSVVNFNEKFKRAVSEGEDKTREIMDSLADFLAEIGKADAKEVIQSLDNKLFSQKASVCEEEEQFEFNLDDVINPKEPLDLKKLCEELGVYRG